MAPVRNVDAHDVNHNRRDNDPRSHHALPRRHKRDQRKRKTGTLRGATGLRTLACRVADMSSLPLTVCAHEAAIRASLTAPELRLALREGDMYPEIEKVRLEAKGVVVVLSCTSPVIVTCWREVIGTFEVEDVLEVVDVV